MDSPSPRKRRRSIARTARVLDLLAREGHARARQHDEETYLRLRLDRLIARGDDLDATPDLTSEDDREERLDR